MNNYREFYADGSFKPATGTERTAVVNPSVDARIGEVHLCSLTDLDAALRSARQGFDVWSDSSPSDRQQALRSLMRAIETRRDEFVALLADEIGCPVWLGGLMQVPMALKDLEFAIEGIDHVIWTEDIGNGVVERVPVGVVGAITPWNFPLHQIVAKVAGAIAAGCSVILKPSEVSPGVAHCFMQAVHEAGLPPGLVNSVWGGPEVGAALVADRRVDQVSFTGSTAVGRRIMSACAERVARVTLELGGKSAAVLLEDANLDKALPAVLRLSMANSGQACVSQSRLIAPRHLVPEIERRLVELTRQWPLGDPHDEGTRLGPVANASQFSNVNRMINGASEAGAKLLCGGLDRPRAHGFFVAPTIFSEVGVQMALAQEEVFGPVLAVMAYEDEEDAVRLANSTSYGLSGAVWSADLDRAAHIARRMRTGQVVLNGAAQNLATPFGGWGQSGFGRENGRFGIEECLQFRSLHGLGNA